MLLAVCISILGAIISTVHSANTLGLASIGSFTSASSFSDTPRQPAPTESASELQTPQKQLNLTSLVMHEEIANVLPVAVQSWSREEVLDGINLTFHNHSTAECLRRGSARLPENTQYNIYPDNP